MFPIILDVAQIEIALLGQGAACINRLRKLDKSGASRVTVFSEQPEYALKELAGNRLQQRLPSKEELANFLVVMIVDLPKEQAEAIATDAREVRTLVNIEDNIPYCDFHFPSYVKRGNLLISVSTAGKSPTVSRVIREDIAKRYGEEWRVRLEEIAEKRQTWREEDQLTNKEIIQETENYIKIHGWMPSDSPLEEGNS